MTTYTNEHNLPDAMVKALVFDDYDYHAAGDISATGIIQPPRIRQLTKRHRKEITEDVSELIWRMAGSIGHKIVERGAGPNVFSEERLTMQLAGWTITGKVDLMRTAVTNIDGWNTDTYAIEDFKFRSVWAAKDLKPEDEQQLNIYATLARHNRFCVTELRIISVLRDWSKLRATREKDYPQVGVAVREIPLWEQNIAESFLEYRVIQHQEAEKLSDGNLPMCTQEERWHKPDTWAVKKKGNKRATKVLETHADAAEMIRAMGGNFEVEHRLGEDVRCLNYCAVRQFCSYGKSLAPATEEA